MKRAFLIVILAASPGLLVGQPVPWNHPDGTTHWYQAIAAPGGVSWVAAHNAARQANGHLATITSQAENAVVFSLIDDPAFWLLQSWGGLTGPWLGGAQPAGSVEPGGGWQWTTGEPFAYSNWDPAQPDNSSGNQDRIHFGEVTGVRAPTWGDRARYDASLKGYVIEWDAPPDQTVGLFKRTASSFDGYTLLSQLDSIGTYLVDGAGRVANSWTWNTPHTTGLSTYLLENGDLIRTARISYASSWQAGIGAPGHTGRIEQYAWDGSPVWEYTFDTHTEILHHDIEVMPNGNILMIAWERKTGAEAVAAGRDPSWMSNGEVWPEMIIEVAPTYPVGGTIVWEWHLWDHLIQDHDPTKSNYGVVANHPELVDLNYGIEPIADWVHFNSIDYNPQLDQIVVSSRSFSEIWIIDHGTTTAQAAGHVGGSVGRGGDLLYRWGNPEAYRAGTAADRKLFHQHMPEWIEPGHPGAGNILLFNNGPRPSAAYSTVDEIVPPLEPSGSYSLPVGGAYGPADPVWSYQAVNPTDFYGRFVSGAQRLPNGNTLATVGWDSGTVYELTPSGECVWRYVNPVIQQGVLTQGSAVPLAQNRLFRACRYAPDYPGLRGKNLARRDPVELYPPQIAARFGSVNLDGGVRPDVLLVNGQAGDVWREVYASVNGPLTLTLEAPPEGPVFADHALYLLPFEAGLGTLTPLPLNLGVAAMPMPILFNAAATAPELLLAASPGVPALEVPLIGAAPAPTTIFQGFIPAGTYTIQGLIVDGAPSSPVSLSLTNAVVVTIN